MSYNLGQAGRLAYLAAPAKHEDHRLVPSSRSDIADISYDVTGERQPVLLMHGFASSGRVNWWDTSWVKSLNEASYKTITFDKRGHGSSTKLYDQRAYPAPEMAEDARRLLDHLGIP